MFLARSNVQTLWDVLQEDKIPNLNQQTFLNNINLFGEKERSSGLTLFQLNSLFKNFQLTVF